MIREMILVVHGFAEEVSALRVSLKTVPYVSFTLITNAFTVLLSLNGLGRIRFHLGD